MHQGALGYLGKKRAVNLFIVIVHFSQKKNKRIGRTSKKMLIFFPDYINGKKGLLCSFRLRRIRKKVLDFFSTSGRGERICFFDARRRIIQLKPSRQGGGGSDTVPSRKRHTTSSINPNTGGGRELPPFSYIKPNTEDRRESSPSCLILQGRPHYNTIILAGDHL